MRIILTGTGGRLGGALARHLRDRHRVIAWDRKALDLRSPEQIDDHFSAVAFDAVIHSAAVTSVDYCEKHPVEAREVNAEAPARIARICRERGARFIHVSTDYVYDGSKPGPRVETDPVAPLGVYARSKADGEKAVLETSPEFLVARASWIFGPDRESFVDSIIRRAQKSEDCEAISDKFSSPSYSADMAALLEALLLNRDATGVVNLCNAGGGCSWLEYGQAALDFAAEAGVPLKCRSPRPISVSEMPGFLAPRPVHTGMDTTRLAALAGLPVRHWREALREYVHRCYGRR